MILTGHETIVATWSVTILTRGTHRGPSADQRITGKQQYWEFWYSLSELLDSNSLYSPFLMDQGLEDTERTVRVILNNFKFYLLYRIKNVKTLKVWNLLVNVQTIPRSDRSCSGGFERLQGSSIPFKYFILYILCFKLLIPCLCSAQMWHKLIRYTIRAL